MPKKKKRLRRWVKVTLRGLLAVVIISGMDTIFLSPVKAEENDIPLITIKDNSEAERTIKKIYQSDDTYSVNLNDFQSGRPGLQLSTVEIHKEGELVPQYQEVIIGTVTDRKPEIKTISDKVTVNLNGDFVPESLIAYINDSDSDVMPSLQINSQVDTSKEGDYKVSYKVTNIKGYSSEKEVTVSVVEHPEAKAERLAREEAERKAREEEERRAREAEEARKAEEARIAAEEAARQASLYSYSNTTASAPPSYGGANPYVGGWGNCTWGAWQLMHDNRGISLAPMGNAGQWYYQAAAMGYATGRTPSSGSVVVFGNHVAYVAQVSGDGQSIYIQEGNYMGRYNERWVSAYDYDIQGYIYG